VSGALTAVVYLGGEIGAAGFRLAGAHVETPDVGGAAEALARACAAAPLVLVSAELAARIDPALLRSACSALAPLVVVVPDPQGEAALPDLAARLRTQLGLEG
jgi:vacuolar-type H+-ATPase subunit F/Vma7